MIKYFAAVLSTWSQLSRDRPVPWSWLEQSIRLLEGVPVSTEFGSLSVQPKHTLSIMFLYAFVSIGICCLSIKNKIKGSLPSKQSRATLSWSMALLRINIFVVHLFQKSSSSKWTIKFRDLSRAFYTDIVRCGLRSRLVQMHSDQVKRLVWPPLSAANSSP